MSNYRCPYCAAPIDNKQIDKEKSIAYCRSCNTASPCSVPPVSKEIMEQKIPPWVKVEKNFSCGTKITYRVVNIGALFILIPFAAIWSWVSIWGIYGTQLLNHEFKIRQCLIGIPFLLFESALIFTIVFSMVGKWVITLKNGIGAVFVGIGQIGWNRQFSYNKNTHISIVTIDMRQFNNPSKCIKVSNNGNDFVFGTMIKNNAKNYIAALMAEIAAMV